MNAWAIVARAIWQKDHSGCHKAKYWCCRRSVERKLKGMWLFWRHENAQR